MPRHHPYQSCSPKRTSKAPTSRPTRPYVSSLCAALGQELPSSFALAPPPPPVLAPSQPASGGPPHPPVSETNTAQQAGSSIHQPRAVHPFQQLFRPRYNPPFPSPANPPFSAPSYKPYPPPFNSADLPPSHNGYSQLSNDRHHPPSNRFFSQPYYNDSVPSGSNDSVPSGSNDPIPPLSNDAFPSLSTHVYPSSSNDAYPSLSTRADAYPSSYNGPFPPFHNPRESSSINGPFFAPEDWPLSSFAVDEYYMKDGSGPSSFPTSSDYSYAAHDDTQRDSFPPAASCLYSEGASWTTSTQEAAYGLPGQPEYLPLPILAPVPVPARAYPRATIGPSVLCGESSVEAPFKPPVAARRIIRLPLPPGTCPKYVEHIYVRGELGLQCRACPGIRRTSLNDYIVANVDSAGMVMDDVFPDETVLVHRGLFACDPGAACVFNMASHKSPRHDFTLGRLLTMIVDKQYKAWYSKKWKAGLDLQKIVGAAEEPVRGTAVSYAMVYIVAIRRWRHGKGKWHYFPELEIRL